MKRIRLYTICFVFTLSPFLFSSCKRGNDQNASQSPDSTTQVKLGFRPNVVVDLALLVAIEKGEFERAGLNIVLEPSPAPDQIFTKLENGSIHVSTGVPLEPVLEKAAKGEYPYRAFLVWYFDSNHPYDGFIVLRDSGIITLDDLENKVIGVLPSKQIGHFISVICPKSTVRTYNPASPLLNLKSADFSAVYVLEPVLSLAASSGEYRILETSAISKRVFNGESVPAAVSLISEKWLKKNPKAAKTFLRIAKEAYRKFDREDSQEDVASLLAKKEFGGYSHDLAARILEPVSSLPEELEESKFNSYLRKLTDAELIKGSVDMKRLFVTDN